MSAHVDLDDHFKTTLARDVSAMLLGRYDGCGTHRAIFDHATDPGLVVKVENNAQSFNNIKEWEVWKSVKDDPEVSRWFAPCVDISPSGTVLVMRRCAKVRMEELPAKVPAFFTDLKAENWGRLDGRYVCLDYGLHLLHEHGMTKRMRRARWTP